MQIANLYIQAMTGDVEKVKVLNAYLKSACDGNDAPDVAVIKNLPNRLKGDMASSLKAYVGTRDAALDRAISAFAGATVSTIRRSPSQRIQEGRTHRRSFLRVPSPRCGKNNRMLARYQGRAPDGSDCGLNVGRIGFHTGR
jgi:hypothetical protein